MHFSNQLFRMPSKDRKIRSYYKDRNRTKVSSEGGSNKIIPNCPLQGKKEIAGIHGTLRRTRTYPEYSGRVGANGSGRSGIYKSASYDWINFPRFSKLKFGEQLPFVGCNKCTPWVVCNEHQEWLTIPGHANYTPIFEAKKSPFVHGDSSTPCSVASVTPTKSTSCDAPASNRGPKVKEKIKRGPGRPKKGTPIPTDKMMELN